MVLLSGGFCVGFVQGRVRIAVGGRAEALLHCCRWCGSTSQERARESQREETNRARPEFFSLNLKLIGREIITTAEPETCFVCSLLVTPHFCYSSPGCPLHWR